MKSKVEEQDIQLWRKSMCLLESLIETLGFAHGALDVERAHVLPVLLEQRHQEVDSQVDVVHKLVFCHLHVSNSHSQTEHLQQDVTTSNMT